MKHLSSASSLDNAMMGKSKFFGFNALFYVIYEAK